MLHISTPVVALSLCAAEHQRAFEVMAYGEALPSQAALGKAPKNIPFEWAEGGPPPSWFMEGPWPRETPDSHYWA